MEPFRSKRVERLLEAAGMRLPGLGERLEPVGDLVEAFLAGGAGHARIHVGVFVGLAGERVLQILLGLGSLERRHVPSSAWSEKPMMRGRCARRSRESIQSREFLICGWSRVPVDADDHVDAADGGARGRLRTTLRRIKTKRVNETLTQSE